MCNRVAPWAQTWCALQYASWLSSWQVHRFRSPRGSPVLTDRIAPRDRVGTLAADAHGRWSDVLSAFNWGKVDAAAAMLHVWYVLPSVAVAVATTTRKRRRRRAAANAAAPSMIDASGALWMSERRDHLLVRLEF